MMKKKTAILSFLLITLMVLLPNLGEAQSITRNKKQQTTTTTSKKKSATTNSTTKSKQGSSSSNSGKSKKTNKTTSQQSSSRSSSSTQSSKSSQPSKPIIPAVVQQAINDMVWVEGGTFTMGATSEQGGNSESDEKPAHQVTLSDYYISMYEVTQELWLAVMGNNSSTNSSSNGYSDDLTRPVEHVSWYDCQQFITNLNRLTGKHFRLPTEAEWEYAARGGKRSHKYKYSGSNTLSNVAWYVNNEGWNTRPVGHKTPNELGLYDMSGNVREWCQDWYGSYSSSSQTNPSGPSSGSNRVTRGGYWHSGDSDCRVSSRYHYSPGTMSSEIGLRLAM